MRQLARHCLRLYNLNAIKSISTRNLGTAINHGGRKGWQGVGCFWFDARPPRVGNGNGNGNGVSLGTPAFPTQKSAPLRTFAMVSQRDAGTVQLAAVIRTWVSRASPSDS